MAKRGGSAVGWLVTGAVGLVVGLALGGLAPRAQLRSLEAQIDELGDQSCETRGVGREIASAFHGEPWKAALEDDEVDALDAARDADVDEDEPEDDGVKFEINVGDDGDQKEPESLEEGLTMARDAMAMREAQARAALDEQAAPSEEQWAEIDNALADMNDDLHALAEDFAGTIQDGQEPSRRDAMLYAADTLDVLLNADDQIWGSLTEDQRAAVEDEAVDPMAHIDPALLDVFMELDQ